MALTTSATATWQGDLPSGTGTVSSATSDFWHDLPTSWSSRTEDAASRTNPEEFLAAAHASCFSMAFSNQLAQAGFPPDRVEVRADITGDKREAGWTVISSHLTVHAWVPGVDQETFQTCAHNATDGCPISRALKGNVELSVDATLES